MGGVNISRLRLTEYSETGRKVGEVVEEKQKLYGDSYGKSGNVLKILYPEGVLPQQYEDLLFVTRMLDKLFRFTSGTPANRLEQDESPVGDMVGYCLLEMRKELKRREEPP